MLTFMIPIKALEYAYHTSDSMTAQCQAGLVLADAYEEAGTYDDLAAFLRFDSYLRLEDWSRLVDLLVAVDSKTADLVSSLTSPTGRAGHDHLVGLIGCHVRASLGVIQPDERYWFGYLDATGRHAAQCDYFNTDAEHESSIFGRCDLIRRGAKRWRGRCAFTFDLDADPANINKRAAYATYLGIIGDQERSRFQRWLIDSNNKHSVPMSRDAIWYLDWLKQQPYQPWVWWHNAQVSDGYWCYGLPYILFSRLSKLPIIAAKDTITTNGNIYPGPCFRAYYNRAAAEEDLFQAWCATDFDHSRR